jgi:hypothetical protein
MEISSATVRASLAMLEGCYAVPCQSCAMAKRPGDV